MATRILQRIAATVAIVVLPAVACAETANIRYSEGLQKLEIQAITAHDNAETTSMRFDALGRSFDLELSENRRLLGQLSRQQKSDDVAVFRGNVANEPGSWARIVIANDRPIGMISVDNEIFALETDAESGETIIFRLDDMEMEPGALSCSAPSIPNGAALVEKLSGEVDSVESRAPGATLTLDISVIADFEFTSDKGASNAVAEVVARMNNVDGIFSEQLGVQLTVTRTDTFASDNDPFSDESDAGSLLDELSDYRTGNTSHRSAGLTHLFTGRDLAGSTIGVAYVGAVCSNSFGVGLTEATRSATTDSLIAAHEIGHNFGAPHDGTGGSACSSTSQDFLMAPALNGSDEFSSCSINQMQSEINGASCITDLPQTDVAVTIDRTPATPLLGKEESIRFAIDSIGTLDAANVSVDLDIPNNIALQSVSASTGSCSTGAGSANCSLGAIAAGSGATVTVVGRLDGVGDARIVASITADDDGATSNNAVTATVAIAPAVDLDAGAPASSSATIDQSSTISMSVQNRATIAATNVDVTISVDSDLTINSASWSNGACSIAQGVATCSASQLAANATATISLGVTGSTLGTYDYTISAKASEADIDTANDAASGTLTINEADSGGGALGWPMLLLLLFGVRRALIRRSA